MVEVRLRRHFDGKGNELPSGTYEVSDEELANEAEERELTIEKLASAIDNNFTAKQAVILKRVFARLIKRGYLP